MARIRTGDVQVDGLKELNVALKAIGPDARKELREASKKVATFVANDARSAAFSIGGVAAHVAPSVKPAASISGSSGVSIGGPGYEMAGGAEFGSYRHRRFQPWRGNGSEAGYFLYPAIRQDVDRIETEFTSAIDDIIKRRFPE